MRARLIEPFLKKRKFTVECFTAKWNEDPVRTFALETQDESFNECDTPVLANSTDAGCDPVVITPILEYACDPQKFMQPSLPSNIKVLIN
mgnify:FL=1